MKIYLHHPLYHIPLPKKSFLWCKIHWRSWSIWGPSLKVFFLGFTVKDPSFCFSVIGFSYGFPVIGSFLESSLKHSFLGSSVLFFGHVAIFVLLLFLLKTGVLFCIIFSRRSSHLTISFMCFNNCNKTYSDWKYMSSISRFINHLHCWIYSSYTLYKKWNKILQETDWPFVSF